MREPDALIKTFNNEEGTELVNENAASVMEAFHLPNRNWNLLVDCYNKSNKRKFQFSAIECKVILHHVKRGIPPETIFQSLGVSKQKLTYLMTKYSDLEERWNQLASKPDLTDEEFDEINDIMRHPLRVLMADIDRAKGISDLTDWERFNQMCEKATDMQTIKMKAKFKEFFSERPTETTGFNVSINLGGDFIDKL